MANSKAAKKYILITKRNRDRNKHNITVLKSALKLARLAIQSIDEKTQEIVRATCRVLDKSVTKGIIKKNTAARKKSRLVKAFNQASTSAS
jgi:small subunit ribosomal protein S20